MERERELMSRALFSLSPLPGVHEETSKEIGPGEVVKSVLFGGDSSRDNLCIEVISQHLHQTGSKQDGCTHVT